MSLPTGKLTLDTHGRSPYSALFPQGHADHALVEVRHVCCDGCAVGYWLSVAPGSGIHYDLGRTVAFAVDDAERCALFEPVSCAFVASATAAVSTPDGGSDELRLRGYLPSERGAHQHSDCTPDSNAVAAALPLSLITTESDGR